MTTIEELEKKIELMDTEIESLIISLDVNREIVEGLDMIGIAIYKMYNKIKGIIDE